MRDTLSQLLDDKQRNIVPRFYLAGRSPYLWIYRIATPFNYLYSGRLLNWGNQDDERNDPMYDSVTWQKPTIGVYFLLGYTENIGILAQLSAISLVRAMADLKRK